MKEYNLAYASAGDVTINTGDTAWMMCAAALVMLMTPALGFFYGGLVRHKNILMLIIQCYAIFAAVGIVWALLGYSLAFGDTVGHFIGGSNFMGLSNVGLQPYVDAPTVPGLVFFFFQLCACAITPALVIGAPAERLSLIPSVLFSCFWVILVYCPVCHWVFHGEGWLKEFGARDFAGGMVVHMTAGYSAITMAVFSGKRNISPETRNAKVGLGPHNVSYAVLGAALLWFGWFGYNGGASFGANWGATLAIASTNLSASAGGLSWTILEYIIEHKTSASGIATGTVCGLIAMTPGSGFCPVWASIIIGFIGGACSYGVKRLSEHLHFADDTLDVFACHGICGTWGTFATGLFASKSNSPGDSDGLFLGGGFTLLGYQLTGIAIVAFYSIAMTSIMCFTMRMMGVLRVKPEDEERGLDLSVLHEYAYLSVADVQGDTKVLIGPS